jgi:hypothetical protein
LDTQVVRLVAPKTVAHISVGRGKETQNGVGERITLPGRAHSLRGNTARDHGAYQDFLNFWKDADPHSPILKQANAEYMKLQQVPGFQ